MEDVARILPIALSFGVSITVLAFSVGHISGKFVLALQMATKRFIETIRDTCTLILKKIATFNTPVQSFHMFIIYIGGHMNPAVSFLMFCRRQISAPKMLCYWSAQFVGAMLGASLVWGCVSGLYGEEKPGGTFERTPFQLGSTTLDSSLDTHNGFLLEFLGSFFFFFVIAQCALDKRGIGESYFPALPIGFSLVVVHVCLIPFTGCGVNPARTFGPSVVVCLAGGDCEDVMMGEWYWIYYVGPLLAALAVSEMTLLMEMDCGEEAEEKNEEYETDVKTTAMGAAHSQDGLSSVADSVEKIGI